MREICRCELSISEVIEAFDESVLILDLDGRVLAANGCAWERFGICKEKLTGGFIYGSLPPDFVKSRNAIEEVIRTATKRETEEEFDGRSFHYSWRPVLSESGKVKCVVAVCKDTTDRKKTEKDFLESEEKYRRLFEMESDAIFLIENWTGNIIEVNPAGEALYGYGRDELLTMDHAQVSVEPADTRQAAMRHRTTVPVRWHKKKDGTVFPVEITARHFTWKGKEVHIAAIRDISSRIKAEEESRQLESQLQQAQRMETIGTLAGGIAHDFNNILFPIIGYAELLLQDAAGKDRSRAGLNEILIAANRARELTNQILTFSRESNAEVKPIYIQPIINEVLKFIRSTVPSNIEIRKIMDDCGPIHANPTQIHQVLMNLITNACHAMENTGGVLEIRLDEIDLGPENPNPGILSGRHACLAVSDAGIGMDETVSKRIFEPYFTTKEKGKGTGLGLSVVHGIVKRLKGDIGVFTRPGKGTSFMVYLPLIEFCSVRTDAIPREPIARGSERILLIDDDEQIVKLEKDMLERLGYQITARTSSIEGLEAFRHRPDRFDLVITDMSMPNMNGDRLARELIGIRPDIPIILCTGYSEQIDENTSSEIGIKALVMKPVVLNDLSRIIRSALKKM